MNPSDAQFYFELIGWSFRFVSLIQYCPVKDLR